MQIAIIDIQFQTYNYLQTTQSSLEEFVHIECAESDELSLIAERVSKDNFDTIFINVECKYENSNRSDVKGIELIYWLRLKENFLGTIITYGFLSSAQILRLKPEYVVLHAPGNYHLRLPDLNGIEKYLNGNTDLNKETLTDKYKSFAEKYFNIHQARHEKANWWAIKTMWDIENIRKKEKKPYPAFIQNKLKELNNYLVAEIYKDSELIRIEDIVLQITTSYIQKTKEIQEKRRKLKSERKTFTESKKKTITDIEKQIEENNDYILLCKEEITQNQSHISDLQLYGQKENISYVIENKSLQKEIEDISNKNKELIVDLNNIKQEQYKNKNSINIVDDEVEEQLILSDTDQQLLKESKIKIKNQTALLVEDMLDNGWLELYQRLFPNIKFVLINFSEIKGCFDDKIDFLQNKINNKLLGNSINFIILDIRLFPEDNTETDKNYSGFIVLDYIRENFEIPVLITSASNKIWTLDKIKEKGANDYWMKEGFDNFFTKTESITNYLELKKIIVSYSGIDYKILNKINKLYNDILNCKKCWWEDYTWEAKYITNNINKPNKSSFIIKIPDESKKTNVEKIYILNELKSIQQFVNFYLRNKEITTSKMYKLVIIEMGEILSKFHSIIQIGNTRITIGNTIISRGDDLGRKLQGLRNDYFHKGEVLTNELLLAFIDSFQKYLMKNPIINYHLKNNQNKLEKEFIKRKKQDEIVKKVEQQEKDTPKNPDTKIIKKQIFLTKENRQIRFQKEQTKTIEEPIQVEQKNQSTKTPTEKTKTDSIGEIKPKNEQNTKSSFISSIIHWFSNLFKN